jgi:Uma2 family endonuclease
MALGIAESYLSVQDYLEGEKTSEIRHEYIAGNVYAISGGTMAHQRVATNFLRHAGNQLSEKPCEPTNSDFQVRIKIGHEWAFYYSDAMIVCDPVPDDACFTDSPTVILEVLSPSTRRNDEVQKFRDYMTIPSLKVYLIAEADCAKVTIYRRVGEEFRSEILINYEASLDLPEVGISIPMTDLYRDVEIS